MIPKSELLKNGIFGMGGYQYLVKDNIFGKPFWIKIFFFESKDQFDLSDYSVYWINKILTLNENHLNQVKKVIWDKYQRILEGCFYGDEIENAKIEYGIFNESDAFLEATFEGIYIGENYGIWTVDFTMSFSVIWEQEHGLNIHFKDDLVSGIE